jgi:hypothetical protein
VNVLLDDAGLAHCLPSQEDDLDLGLARHGADRVVHFQILYILHLSKDLSTMQSLIDKGGEHSLMIFNQLSHNIHRL